MDTIDQTIERIRAFRDARDWMQFHNPKNLACSVVIEPAELLEHFQWESPEESAEHATAQRDEVSAEMADITIYLIEMAGSIDRFVLIRGDGLSPWTAKLQNHWPKP